jgi:hypothetical protein
MITEGTTMNTLKAVAIAAVDGATGKLSDGAAYAVAHRSRGPLIQFNDTSIEVALS